jgi:hypothetical protein
VLDEQGQALREYVFPYVLVPPGAWECSEQGRINNTSAPISVAGQCPARTEIVPTQGNFRCI